MRAPAGPAGDSPSIEEALDLLRRRGGRVTTPRRIVLEALVTARDHRTADELALGIRARHPDIHPSTVYRSLERFEDLGVAYHTHLGHGPAQWHLTSAPHQHLTCQRCGRVIEADPGLFDDVRRALRDKLGFEANFAHFAVTGLCRDCATEAERD
jgi:Fur family transcriptional regulator, ferric uptake regulator